MAEADRKWKGMVLGVVAMTAAASVGSCASTPPPAPAPVLVDTPVVAPQPAARPAEPAAHLEPAPIRPAAVWIPPSVTWQPVEPEEGTALAVRLRRAPAAREPLFVEADLAGVPVHLARTTDGWFGLAPLPIESAGRRLLSIRFGIGRDSVEERLVPLAVRDRPWPSARLRIRSRTSDPSPEVQARLRREREAIVSALRRVTPDWLAHGGFDWPRRDRITSPFGERRVFRGEVQSLHLGLDVAGRSGTPVRAAGRGRVALAGRFLLQGNAVYLDHGLGVFTGYFHLSGIDVVEGEMVEPGRLLGRIGATGRVTGPHLHWSLYVSGHSVDPRSVLDLDVPGWTAGSSGPGSDPGAVGAEAAGEPLGTRGEAPP